MSDSRGGESAESSSMLGKEKICRNTLPPLKSPSLPRSRRRLRIIEQPSVFITKEGTSKKAGPEGNQERQQCVSGHNDPYLSFQVHSVRLYSLSLFFSASKVEGVVCSGHECLRGVYSLHVMLPQVSELKQVSRRLWIRELLSLW